MKAAVRHSPTLLLALPLLALLAASLACRLPLAGKKTPDCRPPTLALGERTFEIRSFSPGKDGNVSIPAGESGRAYRLEGTEDHPVFYLSPTMEGAPRASSANLRPLPSALKLQKPGWVRKEEPCHPFGRPGRRLSAASLGPAERDLVFAAGQDAPDVTQVA